MKVSFNANGGACRQISKNVNVGGKYGAMPIPTRSGYTFVGWWAGANRETKEITSNSIVDCKYNHTLYAHWARKYKIVNVAFSKALSINTGNQTVVRDCMNVYTMRDTGKNNQRWLISRLGNSQLIRSVINPNIGLNVNRATRPRNCNVLKTYGNEKDALVQFNKTSYGDYKIKLVNYNLYLTSKNSSKNGADVYWATSSNSVFQRWQVRT